MIRKIICALDTGDLDEALRTTKRLAPCVGAFKIGHALTLPHGLDVIDRLQDAGATRIFLDLKFHDIPNSVALAVREAAKHNVWMLTVHISGGPAMLEAAVEEARDAGETSPYIVGVSVLTSLDQHILTDKLGVQRTILEQMTYLSEMAMDCGLDGVVCSPQEVADLKKSIGHRGFIVTPGIRSAAGEQHDQRRVGTAQQALTDGADYLVIGRALTHCDDIEGALAGFGFESVVQ
jgi:orotidine-5'-phosphate decarboxylase